ncbi:MAG: tetratricopeptide repeat protein [Magnetococcales bacterium]|nr:tetratricopeptide repeat protein [Magnetococcales bacterium]
MSLLLETLKNAENARRAKRSPSPSNAAPVTGGPGGGTGVPVGQKTALKPEPVPESSRGQAVLELTLEPESVPESSRGQAVLELTLEPEPIPGSSHGQAVLKPAAEPVPESSHDQAVLEIAFEPEPVDKTSHAPVIPSSSSSVNQGGTVAQKQDQSWSEAWDFPSSWDVDDLIEETLPENLGGPKATPKENVDSSPADLEMLVFFEKSSGANHGSNPEIPVEVIPDEEVSFKARKPDREIGLGQEEDLSVMVVDAPSVSGREREEGLQLLDDEPPKKEWKGFVAIEEDPTVAGGSENGAISAPEPETLSVVAPVAAPVPEPISELTVAPVPEPIPELTVAPVAKPLVAPPLEPVFELSGDSKGSSAAQGSPGEVSAIKGKKAGLSDRFLSVVKGLPLKKTQRSDQRSPIRSDEGAGEVSSPATASAAGRSSEGPKATGDVWAKASRMMTSRKKYEAHVKRRRWIHAIGATGLTCIVGIAGYFINEALAPFDDEISPARGGRPAHRSDQGPMNQAGSGGGSTPVPEKTGKPDAEKIQQTAEGKGRPEVKSPQPASPPDEKPPVVVSVPKNDPFPVKSDISEVSPVQDRGVPTTGKQDPVGIPPVEGRGFPLPGKSDSVGVSSVHGSSLNAREVLESLPDPNRVAPALRARHGTATDKGKPVVSDEGSVQTKRVNREHRDGEIAQASEAFRRGDLEAAERLFQRVYNADKRDPGAMLGLASVASRRGDVRNAEFYYRKILSVDPRHSVALAGLAGIQGNAVVEGEESRLRQQLRDTPEAAHLHFFLGNLLAAQKRWPEALIAFRNANRLERDNPEIMFNLGVALDHLRRVPEAIDHYQQALEVATRFRKVNFDIDAVRHRIAVLHMESVDRSVP